MDGYWTMDQESKSENEDEETWKTGVLPSLLNRDDPKNIFNADEERLFFNLLLGNTCLQS
jgi:hypothetical protein